MAVRSRDAWYRVAGVFDRLARRGHVPPLPPLHLRIYYYGTSRPSAYTRACEGARAELVSRGLQPHHRVLDIGCGVGNLAAGVADYLHGGYDGIDIHREAVDWCQRAITSRYPTFRFHYADVARGAYNRGGQLAASEFTFPLPAQSFNFVFLGSVFTHLLPAAVEQYALEIARLLVPGSICIASAFLLNEETRAGVDAGTGFMSFSATHPSGLCRLHDPSKPEAAIALEESFVRQTYGRAGLHIRDVRRGAWWRGGPHDQDVIAAERRSP